MTATTITHRATSHEFHLDPPVEVEQQMGNGRRRILADEGTVTARRNGDVFVHLSGRSVKRDGTAGPRRGCGWSIGGRWDESESAPPIAHELIEASR